MEVGLSLLGATAVEDRLQEGVADTLAALGEAGLVVWVLTGDKKETSLNICYSCGHLSQDMTVRLPPATATHRVQVLDLTSQGGDTVAARLHMFSHLTRHKEQQWALVMVVASNQCHMPS